MTAWLRRDVSQSYGLGLDASWELDVFGGIQSGVDAATATADARTADLRDVLVSLAAEVALDYIDVRSLAAAPRDRAARTWRCRRRPST